MIMTSPDHYEPMLHAVYESKIPPAEIPTAPSIESPDTTGPVEEEVMLPDMPAGPVEEEEEELVENRRQGAIMAACL